MAARSFSGDIGGRAPRCRSVALDDFTGNVSASACVGWAEMVGSNDGFSNFSVVVFLGFGLALASSTSRGSGLLETSQMWQIVVTFAFSPSVVCDLGDGLEQRLSLV